MTPDGMVTKASQLVGIDKENKIYFVEFKAKTFLKMWGQTNDIKKPEFEKW